MIYAACCNCKRLIVLDNKEAKNIDFGDFNLFCEDCYEDRNNKKVQ